MTYDVQPDSYLQAPAKAQASHVFGVLSNWSLVVLLVLVLALGALFAAIGHRARAKRLWLELHKR